MVAGEKHVRDLVAADKAHLVHPQYHVTDHSDPVVFVRGEGVLLWDASGREYIDGLACLWNVAVGHGRRELAEVAAAQMETLAFANGYAGYTNPPAIRLAERVCELCYPNMRALFFANSGSEAVEGAIKTARYYWFVRGKPDKVKIIVRKDAYHGGTYGATAATGIPPFHKGFGPLPSGFVRVGTCHCYRCEWGREPASCGYECAGDVEQAVLREGADTVAAVLAEPVHGAGGVIPPAPGYWPRLREICDRHDVLLIADEVITGFGRTGKWFALEHWGVQPDMISVAKAITSAYVPLAAWIMSERVHQAILDAPADTKFMHGYTNSAHPTACAVGLRNLEIIEREGLVERAAAMGERLQAGLRGLLSLPCVGNVRGLGLMAAIEIVADKTTKAAFDPPGSAGARLMREVRSRGLVTRVFRDSLLLAPPLVISESQVDRMVEIVGESLRAVLRDLA